jgi:lysophospholipase L1-like esterase
MYISCFGDSITRGVSYVKGRLRIIKENYPAFLQQLFLEEPGTIIQNKGVFNDNSNLLIQRLQKDIINEIPDIVLICIGGNDCNFKWDEVANAPDEKHKPIVQIQNYISNVKTIVNKIRDTGITPVIVTLPPLDPARYYRSISNTYGTAISHWISSVGGIEHWHGLYNRSLNALIQQMNVVSIDVRSALKMAGNLRGYISDDGIHLTPEGYSVMSKKIYSDLKSSIIPACQRDMARNRV